MSATHAHYFCCFVIALFAGIVKGCNTPFDDDYCVPSDPASMPAFDRLAVLFVRLLALFAMTCTGVIS